MFEFGEIFGFLYQYQIFKIIRINILFDLPITNKFEYEFFFPI